MPSRDNTCNHSKQAAGAGPAQPATERHDALQGQELQRSIGKISQKALTDNLRTLEDYDIAHREVFTEVPPRVEYSLTETGQSLRTVIDAIWTWGEEHKERLRLQDK